MYIRMDNREPDQVCELLRDKFGIIVNTEQLEVGDYVFSDLCIERKTTADLLKSLRDGRIWEQLQRSKDNYPRVFVILEGYLPYAYDKSTAVDESKAIGGVLGIAMGWNIPIIPSNNIDQTARIIAQAFGRADKTKTEYLRPVKKKHYNIKDIKEDIVCTIPGVGRSTAREILKRYPDIISLANASEKDLKAIPRVGSKTAEWIKNVFS